MNKLFLITILLIATECFSQFQPPDSIQVKKIIAIKAQRDSLLIVTNYLQTENDSLKAGIAIRDRKISAKQNIIEMQDNIISYMEKQIKKFEDTPIVKEVVKWAGVIISSIAAGIITGLIIR